MPLTVKRVSVVEQTSDLLKAAIASGHWQKTLPGERVVSKELGISRTSYRLALRALIRTGWVKPLPGQGTRILRLPQPKAVSPERTAIGLLLPHPLGELRPNVTLWVQELRAQLTAIDRELNVFHGERFYAENPDAALHELTRNQQAGCWIVVMSTQPTQQWFARRKIPCVVAGTPHEGVELPGIDVDFRAVCRHAAGVLRAAGHQRIALLNRRLPGPNSNQRGAGDQEGEAGFLEAVTHAKAPDVSAQVVYHDCTHHGVAQAMRKVLGGSQPATGLVVTDSRCYLAAMSFLAERRLRIPQDISVISRDHDIFLDYLLPAPTCYVLNPEVYARRVFTQVQHALRYPARPTSSVRIFPNYVAGESVGRPPARPYTTASV